jgi:tetratricopeptide (TPR) repeat protein
LPSRGRAGPLYFEPLREAASRLAEGLVRLGPPASPAEIAGAERALGHRLPHVYRELLASFNGVDLFGESVLLLGVGRSPFGSLEATNRAPRPDQLGAGELVVGQTSEGDLLALPLEPAAGAREPCVFQLRPDADERWLAGSSFTHWLEAILAREEVLYDREGEFKLEAFEPDGEVTAAYALKQAERAVRKDAGSALAQYELGLALRRLGRLDRAGQAFARASELGPENPWPWFDLGRTQHDEGDHGSAALSLQQAARAAPGPAGARFLAWAARCLAEASDRAGADRLLADARQRHPGLAEELRRAAEAESGDAQDLAALVAGEVPLRRRLPVLGGSPKPPSRRR